MLYTDLEIALTIAFFVASILVLGHFIPKTYSKLSTGSLLLLKYYLYRRTGLVNEKGDLIGKAKIKAKLQYAKLIAPVKTESKITPIKPLTMATKHKVKDLDLSVPTFKRNGREITKTDTMYSWKSKDNFTGLIDQNLNLAKA